MIWKKAVLVLTFVFTVFIFATSSIEEPSGLAVKKVQQSKTPDHSILLIVLSLAIAVVGAHSLGHICRRPLTKRIVILVFLGGFVLLGGMFGMAVTSPTSAFAYAAEKTASVLSALGLVALFSILGAEFIFSHRHSENLEVEEKWERRQ